MVGLLRWYWQTLFAGPRPPNLPRPLPFSQGCAGIVESIVIDGKRWFYGFDTYYPYMITTPLIDDPDVMAAFASWYMRPNDDDARAGPAFWRGLVDRAIDGSEPIHIVSSPFSTADFPLIATKLAAAEAENRPIAGFAIPDGLLDLLAVARGSELPSDMSASVAWQAKLGLSESDNDVTNAGIAAEMLAGTQPLEPGATYANAATFLRGYLSDLVNRAPGNWKTMFQGLITPQPAA